jgi:hypothetical protein
MPHIETVGKKESQRLCFSAEFPSKNLTEVPHEHMCLEWLSGFASDTGWSGSKILPQIL